MKIDLREYALLIIAWAVCLAVTWFVLGLCPRADAATGGYGNPAAGGPMPDRHGLIVEAIERIYEEIVVEVQLEDDYDVVLLPDMMCAACVHGRSICLSYKYISRLRTVDEAARIIGHEVAHIKLGHIACEKTTNDKMEAEADYWGCRYARMAGYNPDVCGLLRRENFPEGRIRHLEKMMSVWR